MSTPPFSPDFPGTGPGAEPHIGAGGNDAKTPGPLRGSAAALLVPQTRLSGPIPWVIAIMIALVVIAAAGGLALSSLANNARADLSGAVTVQIADANAAQRTQKAADAAKLLTGQDLVATVRVVPEEELDEMLRPWLGEGAGSQELPIPALIDVQLNTVSGPAQVARLQAALDEAVPGARVDAQSDWLQPVYSALSALQYLALALIILLTFACAAAVWLASRSAFANHQNTVEIMHLLGGTDAQITRIFQRSVVRDAAFGGLVGLALGVGAVWLLGQQFAALDSGMVSGGGLGWTDWAIIAAIPLAGILLALITGRLTILMALRRML